MGKIVYNRGTTYSITHQYTGTSGASPNLGVWLLFTVKAEVDDDITDSAAVILKNIAMSGVSFPQSTLITINPGDVADTNEDGNYIYDIKIIDSTGAIYLADSGTFVLDVTATNRITG